MKMNDLESWSSLSRSRNDSEQVVAKRVTEMFCQVLNRTFSGDICLEVETKHGKHSKSAILNFLHLQQCSLVWIICKPQWVKWTTWMKFVFEVLFKINRSQLVNQMSKCVFEGVLMLHKLAFESVKGILWKKICLDVYYNQVC